MQLTSTEEQLMEHLWNMKKGFMKDLLECFPEPKPASTTVATLLKRMIDKQFVSYNLIANNREYYPLVSKNDYFSKHVNGLIKHFFNDSASQFASFFTTQTDLSESELKELQHIINVQLKKKQQ
jgi:BlaI family penicillinase repressor